MSNSKLNKWEKENWIDKTKSALPDKFAQLNQELGLPARLHKPGLTKEELEPLATKTKENYCTPTNPRPLQVGDFRQLYLEAW